MQRHFGSNLQQSKTKKQGKVLYFKHISCNEQPLVFEVKNWSYSQVYIAIVFLSKYTI